MLKVSVNHFLAVSKPTLPISIKGGRGEIKMSESGERSGAIFAHLALLLVELSRHEEGGVISTDDVVT